MFVQSQQTNINASIHKLAGALSCTHCTDKAITQARLNRKLFSFITDSSLGHSSSLSEQCRVETNWLPIGLYSAETNWLPIDYQLIFSYLNDASFFPCIFGIAKPVYKKRRHKQHENCYVIVPMMRFMWTQDNEDKYDRKWGLFIRQSSSSLSSVCCGASWYIVEVE